MRKLLLFLFLSGNVLSLYAQNLPDATKVRPVATPVAVPAAYTSAPVNYIRTWTPELPATDAATVTSTSRSVTEVKQITQYMDGLGRQLQTVEKAISTGSKDLISPIIYDAFGREQFRYLSYTPTGTATTNSDGSFKRDPFNAQKAFYLDLSLNPAAVGENVYYNRTDFEAAPADVILNSYSAGNTWAKNDPATVERGGNRPEKKQYALNSVADSVIVWDITTAIPATTRFYNTGELYKDITIDEAGNQRVDYKDKEGRIVLKKAQLAITPGTAHIGWLCTYYVYDDFGSLRTVIPPLGVQAGMLNHWNMTGITDELCFQYQYDGRKRMTVKKVPGIGAIYMVYDKRNRLVFTQNATQRLKSPQEWLTTFYDGSDRPVMTAIYKANTTQDALQSALNGAAPGVQTITYNFPVTDNLVLSSYDGSTVYKATQSITFLAGFDSGAAEFTTEIDPAGTSGSTVIAAANTLPAISSSALTPLTYTYYDNYNYTGKLNYVTADLSKPQAGSNPYAAALPSSPTTITQSLITGTKVRILDTDQWLTTTTYYDDKGRAIQMSAENSAGGKDIITNLYNYSGKIISSYQRHTNQHSSVTPQTTMLTMLTYDAGGRLLNTVKRINDDPAQDKTIVANSYDELGLLKQRRLGVTGTTTQLDVLSYTYNLRGWIKSVNKDFVNDPTSTSNWFGQELNYDYGFVTPQYTGNITGTKWKSKSDGITRAYGYMYDYADRITSADFAQQNTSGATFTRTQTDFSVSGLTYDANGNIITMSQQGMSGKDIKPMDQLTYRYSPAGSNKLLAVTDGIPAISPRLGDFTNGTNTGDDYTYDANGNLTSDLNKNISVTYNYLNLPTLINVTGKGSIGYQYDANGIKVKKTVTDNSGSTPVITVTDYIGNLMYIRDTLRLISHEDGRIRPVYKTGRPVIFAYDYFEKDHLGNTRVVLGTLSDTSVYTATMETAAAQTENALFSNIDVTRIAKPQWYPTDNTTNPNQYVALLNARTGQKIGPSLVLRVMAGDIIEAGVSAAYTSTAANVQYATPDMMFTALIQALSGSALVDGGHSATGAGSPISSSFNGTSYLALTNKNSAENDPAKPKAYLNYVTFDDQFAMVNENSGVKQVQGSPNVLQILGTGKIVIKHTGFLYIYTSNQSEQDVLFDNLVVVHNGGPLLEETHYYPFGLTMAGISSKALKGAGYAENQLKYNGIEKIGDLGLEDYDAKFRELDPQIGRWWEIDPKTEKMEMWSPYVSNYNNPIRFSDPLGDDPGDDPPAWRKLLASSLGILNGLDKFLGAPGVNSDRFPFSPIEEQYYNKATLVAQIVPLFMSPQEVFQEPTPTLVPIAGPPMPIPVRLKAPTVPLAGDLKPGDAQRSAGPNAENKLKPYKGKEGEPDAGQPAAEDHSSFLRDKDGNIYKYETYKMFEKKETGQTFWDPLKRFDGGKPDGTPGQDHVNKVTSEPVSTPHVSGNETKVDPATGKEVKDVPIQGGTRPAKPAELPQNQRFMGHTWTTFF